MKIDTGKFWDLKFSFVLQMTQLIGCNTWIVFWKYKRHVVLLIIQVTPPKCHWFWEHVQLVTGTWWIQVQTSMAILQREEDSNSNTKPTQDRRMPWLQLCRRIRSRDENEHNDFCFVPCSSSAFCTLMKQRCNLLMVGFVSPSLSVLFEVYGNTQTSKVKEVNYRVPLVMHYVVLFEVI